MATGAKMYVHLERTSLNPTIIDDCIDGSGNHQIVNNSIEKFIITVILLGI